MSDDIHALIGAYAVDAVTDTERAEFEEHLAVCEHCRAELAGLREAAATVGSSVPMTPPPALRDAILGAIGTVRPLPPQLPLEPHLADRRRRPFGRRFTAAIAAAAAAAALVVGGLAWHPWTGSQPATTSAVQQVLHAPDAHRYVKHLDSATATVIFSPREGKSVLQARHMPPAPAGHTYQLWYMTASGSATGAGFLTPSGTGTSTVLLNGDADHAALVGITVEPAGGSPQPTTKPIMTVKLTT
jgi:anti-sigma-K factor RskA